MSQQADFIAAMKALGHDADVILDVVSKAEEIRLQRKREKTRDRVRRHREKQADVTQVTQNSVTEAENVTDVTPETVTDVTPPTTPLVPPLSPKPPNPPYNPPTTPDPQPDASADVLLVDELTEAFEAYQRIASRLKTENGGDTVWPIVKRFNKKRRSALKARIDEYGLEDWGKVLRKAAASNHCRGLNDRQWVASFDFLTSPSGFLKTLEGNYDNRTSPNPPPGSPPAGSPNGGFGQSSNPALRVLGRLQEASRGQDHDAGVLVDGQGDVIEHEPVAPARYG